MLLKIILPKNHQAQAISELNSDLAALVRYGEQWFIEFAPLKTRSLLISLKSDKHDIPSIFLNDIQVLPEDSVKILGFILILL